MESVIGSHFEDLGLCWCFYCQAHGPSSRNFYWDSFLVYFQQSFWFRIKVQWDPLILLGQPFLSLQYHILWFYGMCILVIWLMLPLIAPRSRLDFQWWVSKWMEVIRNYRNIIESWVWIFWSIWEFSLMVQLTTCKPQSSSLLYPDALMSISLPYLKARKLAMNTSYHSISLSYLISLEGITSYVLWLLSLSIISIMSDVQNLSYLKLFLAGNDWPPSILV